MRPLLSLFARTPWSDQKRCTFSSVSQSSGLKRASSDGSSCRAVSGLTSGNILKISELMCSIPLVSTSYLSLVPEGVFLLVVKRNEGALQQWDKELLEKEKKQDGVLAMAGSTPFTAASDWVFDVHMSACSKC
ncbi:hypothetical protein COCON_G00169590 [Conger conger]|uniref:Uncharacterized protein n=1 Tax=Conger conger TaxID=82655 RepID=A0A9Q1D7K0_CONCO|nr:hypothetical protein COCON_G00169590 [Conger conger]